MGLRAIWTAVWWGGRHQGWFWGSALSGQDGPPQPTQITARWAQQGHRRAKMGSASGLVRLPSPLPASISSSVAKGF